MKDTTISESVIYIGADDKDIDLRLLINKYNQANVKYAEG